MDSKVEINFESHPPIPEDLEGIATLLRQSLFNFVDCNKLAQSLIDLKDVTQVIASEASDEDDTGGGDEEDEPDDNIFGVISYVGLEDHENLLKYMKNKCPKVKELLDERAKIAVIFNERYINLPPQLSVPTLRNLTGHLDKASYTHLILISKVLIRSKLAPSKKRKTEKGQEANEPIIYLNPEEEIVFESCIIHIDIDVSSQCESIDTNYQANRRIMIIDYKDWKVILENIEKELK